MEKANCKQYYHLLHEDNEFFFLFSHKAIFQLVKQSSCKLCLLINFLFTHLAIIQDLFD